jgi:acyl-CoA synthetase (NDP forming)
MKSGCTAAGSARGPPIPAPCNLDVASDALFKQAGIIRVDTLEQLFDVANLLAHQPIPHGRRVAILTNGGGPAILAADACESHGLQVPPLREETKDKLREFLPPLAGLANPVDMLAAAKHTDYAHALRILLEDDDFDAVITIYIPPLEVAAEVTGAAIRDAVLAYGKDKTVLACFMSAEGAPPQLVSGEGRSIPSFAFPEAAATALATVCEYGEWRAPKEPCQT